MAPATFDGFFDLPGELREQILMYLLVKPEGIHIDEGCKVDLMEDLGPDRQARYPPLLSDSEDSDSDSDGDDGYEDEDEGPPAWPLGYLLVSQAFHREASAVFLGENVFHLYATKSSSSSNSSSQRTPRGPAAPFHAKRGVAGGAAEPRHHHHKQQQQHEYRYLETLRRIRRVVLHVGRLGGALEGRFIPALREMALGGGLKHLEVRVLCTPAQRARGPAGLWGSSPGRGLLALLRDPDLDAARLRFCLLPGEAEEEERQGGREEVSAWCPRRRCRGGSAAGGLVTARDGEGRVWCDLDIEELVRRYGGDEVGIFKVGEERSLLRWAAC